MLNNLQKRFEIEEIVKSYKKKKFIHGTHLFISF